MAGEMGGAEGEPGEVEALFAQQLLGQGRDPGRRRNELLTQRDQVAHPRAAEDLSRAGPAAEAPRELATGRGRARPAWQHDTILEGPSTDERSLCALGRPAFVGVDRKRSQIGLGQALPNRGRGRERGGVASSLVIGRPLEWIEHAVVAELHAAVKGVKGAGRKSAAGVSSSIRLPRRVSSASAGRRPSPSSLSSTATLAESNCSTQIKKSPLPRPARTKLRPPPSPSLVRRRRLWRADRGRRRARPSRRPRPGGAMTPPAGDHRDAGG